MPRHLRDLPVFNRFLRMENWRLVPGRRRFSGDVTQNYGLASEQRLLDERPDIMAKLTPWRWWYGGAASVEDEGHYCAEFATRDEAIAAAMRDVDVEGEFYLIEAQLWKRATEPPDVIDLCARVRNGEKIVKNSRAIPMTSPGG